MSALGFEIDPDITQASTPPGAFYSDPQIFERVKTRVFAPSWQLAGDAEDVREPGCARPIVLHPTLLDQPIVFTRDASGRLHGLSNVCTHRGNVVVCAAAQRSALVCGYHGRRFDLDGRFRAMPAFEGVRNFPSAADDLPKVGCASWGRLLFASIAPTASFDDWTADVRRRMGWLPTDGMQPDPARSREFEVRANWALYCENYLEGFHIPFVHAALSASIELDEYTTETFASSSVQIAHAKPGEAAFDPPPGSPEHGRKVAGYYWFLFPNLMLNFYPWGLSINVVRPLAVDRTRVSFLAYVRDASALERGAGAGLDRVEHEDEAVVEAVQRGVRSRLYGRGRYSPTRERGVHHFHRLLLAQLA
ncbi:MAG TPA: SRPBCC family protein [Planctomycetota bacterium]|jgi:choline monooxygenase|nr:SRPBCC family protein [Planctomycetota bacterium]